MVKSDDSDGQDEPVSLSELVKEWKALKTPAKVADVANAFGRLLGIVEKMDGELSRRKKRIKDLTKTVAELEKKVESMKASPPASPETFSSMLKAGNGKAGVAILTKVRKELADSERIEKNIIVSGLTKVGKDENEIEANDKANVDKVLEVIEMSREQVMNQTRIKTRNEKTDLILIEFKQVEYRTKALRGAKNLATREEFKGVYVNKDKTRVERLAEKELRIERNSLNDKLPYVDKGRHYGLQNERKYYWGIRFGELRKIFE